MNLFDGSKLGDLIARSIRKWVPSYCIADAIDRIGPVTRATNDKHEYRAIGQILCSMISFGVIRTVKP